MYKSIVAALALVSPGLAAGGAVLRFPCGRSVIERLDPYAREMPLLALMSVLTHLSAAWSILESIPRRTFTR